MPNITFSIRNILDGIIPITRFNRGEAGKIFDEVGKTGVKVVLKNNAPVAVLVAPEQYEAMVEMLEDYALYVEAENRLNTDDSKETVSHAQVLVDLGISEADLADIDVEID